MMHALLLLWSTFYHVTAINYGAPYRSEKTFVGVGDGFAAAWGGDLPPENIQARLASSQVKEVYSTRRATAVLLETSEVIAFGHAEYGGFVTDSVTSELRSGVISVSSTYSAFAALKEDGRVLVWGAGGGGGVPEVCSAETVFAYIADCDVKTSVASILNKGGITKVSGSYAAFAAITPDGLISWGRDVGGIIPNGLDVTGKFASLISGYDIFVALRDDGTAITWKSNNMMATANAVLESTSWSSIYTNAHSAVAVAANGNRTYAFGSSTGGGAIPESKLPLIQSGIKVIASTAYTFAALVDDALVVWGQYRTHLQCSDGNSDDSCVIEPIEDDIASNVVDVTTTYSAYAVLKSDKSVVSFGDTRYGADSSAVKSQLVDVVRVYSNSRSFAALKTDSSVVVWGNAVNGGEISESVVAKLRGRGVRDIYNTMNAFAAVTEDGGVIAWGNAAAGGNSTTFSTSIGNSTVDWIGGSSRLRSSTYPDVYRLDENRNPFPTGQPTGQPTPGPSSHPTSAPTSVPTSNPTHDSVSYVETAEVGAEFVLEGSIYYEGRHLFDNLGHLLVEQQPEGGRVYLKLDIYATGFGPKSTQFSQLSVLTDSGERVSVGPKCAPNACAPLGGAASEDPTSWYNCFTNVDVTEYVQPSLGGSLLVSVRTLGVLASACPFVDDQKKESNVYLRMSLGYSAVPTPVPTAAPTDISQHPKFLEKSDLEVNIGVEWATNITVLAFALFAVLGIYLGVARRKKGSKAVSLNLARAGVELGAVGAEFVSMIFLLDQLFVADGGQWRGLAGAFIGLRMVDVVYTAYFFYYLYGTPERQADQPFVKQIDHVHMAKWSKAYSIVVFLMMIDVSTVVYLPWYQSPFSTMTFGFPNLKMYRECSAITLFTALATIACQVPYLAAQKETSLGNLFFYLSLSISCVKLAISGLSYITKATIASTTSSYNDETHGGGGEGEGEGEGGGSGSGGSANVEMMSMNPLFMPKRKSVEYSGSGCEGSDGGGGGGIEEGIDSGPHGDTVPLLSMKVDRLQKELREENRQLRDELMALVASGGDGSSGSYNDAAGFEEEGGGPSSPPVTTQSSSVPRGQSGRSSIGGTGSHIKINPYSAKTNPLAKRGSTRMSARLDSVPSLVADSRGESSVL